jgi:hypothetical protein
VVAVGRPRFALRSFTACVRASWSRGRAGSACGRRRLSRGRPTIATPSRAARRRASRTWHDPDGRRRGCCLQTRASFWRMPRFARFACSRRPACSIRQGRRGARPGLSRATRLAVPDRPGRRPPGRCRPLRRSMRRYNDSRRRGRPPASGRRQTRGRKAGWRRSTGRGSEDRSAARSWWPRPGRLERSGVRTRW